MTEAPHPRASKDDGNGGRRPRKLAPRKKPIVISFTVAQADWIIRQSEARQISMSDFCRRMVDHYRELTEGRDGA